MPSNFRLFLRRLRNSRGFGVHSPMAFSIIKEAIRPSRRYTLYDIETIEAEAHGASRNPRLDTLIWRMAVFCECHAISLEVGIPLDSGMKKRLATLRLPDATARKGRIRLYGKSADMKQHIGKHPAAKQRYAMIFGRDFTMELQFEDMAPNAYFVF